MNVTYTPPEGSLAWVVIEFLASNPDEELDAETIAAKFDRPQRDVHTSLGQAVRAQALLRQENDEGELVYRLGPKPPEAIRPKRHRHPVLPAAKPALQDAAKRAMPTRETRFDLASIRIDRDVPPPGQAKSVLEQWGELLARLQPGDSFAWAGLGMVSLRRAMAQYHHTHPGQKLTMRTQPDGSVRVWRIA